MRLEWLGGDEPIVVDLENAEHRVVKANRDGTYQILVYADNHYFHFKRARIDAFRSYADDEGIIYTATTKEIWDSWGKDLPEGPKSRPRGGKQEERMRELPPVEPPKKVVAQIKVDVDEVVERIKEEYEIKDRPVCEDAIRCYEFLKERIGSEITDNAEEFEKWFERMVWHVQKCSEHDTEMRNVSKDAISRADTIKAMCRECTQEGRDECREDCTEVAVVKGMPPVEPVTSGYVQAEHTEGGKK